MAGPRPRPPFPRALALAIPLVLAGALAAPEPARAQGLFELLGSIFRGAAPRAYRVEPPRLLEGFPHEPEEAPRSSGGPQVAFCVRLCDGRHFPLPRNAGVPSMTPAQVCSAMCPAAKTQVFHGSQIDHAVSSSGRGYARLENAFLYRDRLVEDCSCTGTDTTGVARIDVEADPTLRPGDIVVTADGPVVFTGSRRPPHRAADFTPAERVKGLPGSVRRQLSDMRVGEDAGPANVRSDMATGEAASPALSLAPEEPAPAAGHREARGR